MSILLKIHDDWRPVLSMLNHDNSLLKLNNEILPNISYQPKAENIFKVFEKPISDIKVVILGQDPYPTSGDATGLAFAVSETTRPPVSLKNIYKEIVTSIGLMPKEYEVEDIPISWKTLEHWQEQGVFLLNTALTVETGRAGSHLKYWEEFIKRVISFLSYNHPCIWVLWGTKAQKFSPYISKPFKVNGYDKETIENIPINPDWNYILTAPHPAAEAYTSNAGFYGCNHFYYINSILKNKSLKEIKW